MSAKRRMMLAVGLLPLLLVSCYKDFEQMRIKPFRPNLVVPVAEADKVTVMDMLFRAIDTTYLDKTDKDGRLVFQYTVKTGSSAKRLNKLKMLEIDKGVIELDSLFGGSAKVELLTLTLSEGAKITSSKTVSLPLVESKQLQLKENEEVTLEENKEIDIKKLASASVTSTLVFSDTAKSIEKAKVKNVKLPDIDGKSHGAADIGAYEGLLWYKGKLTDLSMDIEVTRRGWLKSVGMEFWLENFCVERRVNGETETTVLKANSTGMPFNEKGKHDKTITLKADSSHFEKNYKIDSALDFSKYWLTRYVPGAVNYSVNNAEDTVVMKAGESAMIEVNTTLRIPLTGKFDALVREFHAGSDNGKEDVALPDINALLTESSSKVRTSLDTTKTSTDLVKLHFYFTNAAPFDVYFAAKLADSLDLLPEGDKGAKVAEIVSNDTAAISQQKLKENNKDGSLKIGDFKFFKAVDCPQLDGKGLSTGTTVREVTIGIPFGEYKNARKSVGKQQVRGLLLFRTPDGEVSSPRLKDHVKVRLGLEVSPKVEIELTNKNK